MYLVSLRKIVCAGKSGFLHLPSNILVFLSLLAYNAIFWSSRQSLRSLICSSLASCMVSKLENLVLGHFASRFLHAPNPMAHVMEEGKTYTVQRRSIREQYSGHQWINRCRNVVLSQTFFLLCWCPNPVYLRVYQFSEASSPWLKIWME